MGAVSVHRDRRRRKRIQVNGRVFERRAASLHDVYGEDDDPEQDAADHPGGGAAAAAPVALRGVQPDPDRGADDDKHDEAGEHNAQSGGGVGGAALVGPGSDDAAGVEGRTDEGGVNACSCSRELYK
jgi:hypothetical protein